MATVNSYQTTAQVRYDTFLKWLYASPVDVKSGEVVLNTLFAKELPVEPYQTQSGFQDDNDAQGGKYPLQVTHMCGLPSSGGVLTSWPFTPYKLKFSFQK